MQAFRFGPAGGALFGVFHPREAGAPRRSAVLLCPPWGQEAIRSQRLGKVLAERLARRGHAVLRFDWYGSGDSDGDDETTSLARWVQDVALADTELRGRGGEGPAVWIGLRLGATVAAIASDTGARHPDGLVLWEPVVDVRHWIDEMRGAHRRALAAAYFGCPIRAIDDTAFEFQGFVLPPSLLQELSDVDGRPLACRANWALQVMPPSASPDGRRVALAPPGTLGHTTATSIDWNSEEAFNASIVPLDAITAIEWALDR